MHRGRSFQAQEICGFPRGLTPRLILLCSATDGSSTKYKFLQHINSIFIHALLLHTYDLYAHPPSTPISSHIHLSHFLSTKHSSPRCQGREEDASHRPAQSIMVPANFKRLVVAQVRETKFKFKDQRAFRNNKGLYIHGKKERETTTT